MTIKQISKIEEIIQVDGLGGSQMNYYIMKALREFQELLEQHPKLQVESTIYWNEGERLRELRKFISKARGGEEVIPLI